MCTFESCHLIREVYLSRTNELMVVMIISKLIVGRYGSSEEY